MMFVKVKVGNITSLTHLCILKTSENQRFSDVFTGYKKRALRRNGLKRNSSLNLTCEKRLVIFLESCFVVAVCCYFINGALMNYAFHHSNKSP